MVPPFSAGVLPPGGAPGGPYRATLRFLQCPWTGQIPFAVPAAAGAGKDRSAGMKKTFLLYPSCRFGAIRFFAKETPHKSAKEGKKDKTSAFLPPVAGAGQQTDSRRPANSKCRAADKQQTGRTGRRQGGKHAILSHKAIKAPPANFCGRL